MNTHRVWLTVVFCTGLAVSLAQAERFVTFPEEKDLVSPDGRYVLRSVDPGGDPANFSSSFHALVLEDTVTGKSRRLCDYLHKIAVAWSGDRIIATDYVGRRAARALVLAADPKADTYIIDSAAIADRVPFALAVHLRQNSHVFVEAVRMDGDTLQLRVWGHGAHDPSGFRLTCTMNLEQASASCEEGTRAPSSP